MGTMEVSSKKLDLNAYVNRTKPTKNREQCHFIWIGILHHNSPRKIEEQMGQDGQLITTPPRLNGEEGLVDLFCGDCSFEEEVGA